MQSDLPMAMRPAHAAPHMPSAPASNLAGARRVLRNYEFRYLDPEVSVVYSVALRRHAADAGIVHHCKTAFLTTRLAKRHHGPGPAPRLVTSSSPPKLLPRPLRTSSDTDIERDDEETGRMDARAAAIVPVLLAFSCPYHAEEEARFWQEALPSDVTMDSTAEVAPMLLREARDLAAIMHMPVAVLLNTSCNVATRQTHHDLAIASCR